MDKKLTIMGISILMLLTIFSSGCFESGEEKKEKEIIRTWCSRYFINIDSNITSNYTLIVPIAMRGDENISEIMYEIELVEGTGSFKIINSEFGSGLQIDGIGDLKIGFEKKSESKNDDEYETEKKYEVGNISMWKDKSFDLDSEETYYNARIWSFASKWDGFINISIEMKYSWNVNREYPCGAHIFYETNAILYANQWDIIKFKTEYFDAI